MKRIIAIAVTLALAGCANYRPLVDMRPGQSAQQYEADLAVCQRYASQVAGAGTQAAVGAIAGAALGAALAAAAGRQYDRRATARVGAVSGAAGGAARGAQSEVNVINRCMAGRGYSVLQ